MDSGREAHGKENPRTPYAVGLRTEPASLVRAAPDGSRLCGFDPRISE